jgi:nicotinate-nucleotide adenylyltransferase
LTGRADVKVGIMGGTFDPIHLAHLIIAEHARSELGLDRVIFIPAGEPWMKSDRRITPSEHRVAMVMSAISSNPAFSISTIEVDRKGPSYTVDTLEKLWEELGYDTGLFLLVGWDSLATVPLWKAPYRISKMATLVSFPRPGYSKPEIEILEAAMPGIAERLIIMQKPFIGISSSEIRSDLACGKSIRYQVPGEVEQYIREKGLYLSRPL